LLASCVRRYDLSVGEPFELSFNYVAPVTRADGSEAVLKLSPHGEDFGHELTAIRHFDGRGMSRLLESDDTLGIALLERLRPGAMLVGLNDDDRETAIAADLMIELHREGTPESTLPTTRDWFTAFANHRSAHHGSSGPLPVSVFEDGEATYRGLLRSSAPSVLLHGDLHHYNILSAEREPWLSIDPHGVIGEPAFEVGAYLGNPTGLLTHAHPERFLERRTHLLAERLGLDRKRVVAWGFAYQTLSAVWSAENDGNRWHRAIRVAELLRSLL
jgi:streptomycin 6-kinase